MDSAARDPSTWTGTCRSRWGGPLAVAGVVGAAASAIWALSGAPIGWFAGALCLLVAVLGVVFTSITVTVDQRGLRIAYGPVRFPVTSVHLDRITAVRVEPDLHPTRWGGWGYRGSVVLFGRSAVVLRRGEAIVVELGQGRTFAVTVDHAEAGAHVLADLLRRPPGPSVP